MEHIIHSEKDPHPCPVCGRPTRLSWCARKDCDIIGAMEEGDFEKGVQVFFDHWKDEVFQSVKDAMGKDPKKWWIPAHLYWGMGVRNMLRTNGFLDDRSPSGNLDDIYIELVEAAVERWANDYS